MHCTAYGPYGFFLKNILLSRKLHTAKSPQHQILVEGIIQSPQNCEAANVSTRFEEHRPCKHEAGNSDKLELWARRFAPVHERSNKSIH